VGIPLKPIIRKAYRDTFHTKTVRFNTDHSDRPFGGIYVPISFLEGNENANEIQVTVKWNR
jgi:hypothetical protein